MDELIGVAKDLGAISPDTDASDWPRSRVYTRLFAVAVGDPLKPPPMAAAG